MPAGTATLAAGLELLQLLATASGPLTATELAERSGLHLSKVSRLLGALAQAGYVRKPSYHAFALGVGVLPLAGSLRPHVPELARWAVPLQALAEAAPGCSAHLATLVGRDLLYLLRCSAGEACLELIAGGWPLHLSSPALCLLIEQPQRTALATLNASRRRYGWERPAEAVPAEPEAVLAAARASVSDEILCLDGWQGAGRWSCAAATDLAWLGRGAVALAGRGRITPRQREALCACAAALTRETP